MGDPERGADFTVACFFLKKHDKGIYGKPTNQPTGRKSFIQKEEIIMMVSLGRQGCYARIFSFSLAVYRLTWSFARALFVAPLAWRWREREGESLRNAATGK